MIRSRILILIALFVCFGAACGDDDGSPDSGVNNNQPLLCGNGTQEGAEECDDGAQNSDTVPDACRTDCTLARCGDGVTDEGEACDDGPRNSNAVPDACRTDCTLPACGDGVVDVASGETCDRGLENSDAPNALCRPDCQIRTCGDGIIDDLGGEVCDGDQVPPGADCRAFGYYAGTPTCNEVCALSPVGCTDRCGDGTINGDPGDEVCDGAPPAGEVCLDYGFDGGHLGCSSYCAPSFARCVTIGWRSTALLPSANIALRGLYGFSEHDVFVVGTGGNFVFAGHWNGASWTVTNLSAGLPYTWLYGLWGSNPADVYAVGHNVNTGGPMVLRWDGSTWSQVTVPGSQPLRAVWGSGPDDVYAVGESGTILHRSSAGWSQVAHLLGTPSLRAVWGSGPSDVWVVGDGGVVLRFDGNQWQQVAHGRGNMNLFGVWGSGAGDLVIVGDRAEIWHFDGSSWGKEILAASTPDLYGVWGSSATDVVAVGAGGAVLRFDGTRWQPQASGVSEDLYAAWGSGPENVFGTGASGVVIRFTADTAWAGDTPAPALGSAFSLWGSGRDDVWVAGNSGLLRRFNGLTWSSVVSPLGTAHLMALWGSASTNVYLAGPTSIMRWSGLSWSQAWSGAHSLSRLWGSGDTDIYALAWSTAGSRNVLLHYGGTPPFTEVTLPPSLPILRDVSGAGPNDVFLVGAAGQIVQGSAASGFTAVAPVTAETLNSVWAAAPDDAWAVGENGILLHYDGVAWTEGPQVTLATLYAVWGTGPQDVFAAGDAGTLLHFDGLTWEPIRTGHDQDIKTLWGVPGEIVYHTANFADSGGSFEIHGLLYPSPF